MRSISGSIFSLLLLSLVSLKTHSQDTLRTYGPRIGVDLARVAYLFPDPPEKGMEVSLDAELLENLYPVLEAGFSTMDQTTALFTYGSKGFFTRTGLDINLLHLPDRSVHHTFTLGFRYGISRFTQETGETTIHSNYWGDVHPAGYQNMLTGHWLEGVAGLRTEVLPNFFLGWSVRYRFLLNPDMDPVVSPRLVPGYGNGTVNRALDFSYFLLFMIPVVEK